MLYRNVTYIHDSGLDAYFSILLSCDLVFSSSETEATIGVKEMTRFLQEICLGAFNNLTEAVAHQVSHFIFSFRLSYVTNLLYCLFLCFRILCYYFAEFEKAMHMV